MADIGSVFVRLPCVQPEELPHIAPADRAYVAEEMTAFLLSWLSELPCRVVNRPTPTCLAGPALRDEQWVRLAWSCGIPSRPAVRSAVDGASAGGAEGPALVTVTVVGQRVLADDVDPVLTKRACTLAAAAGAELLDVHFDGAGRGARLVGAGLWPDVGRGNVADALLELLTGAEPGRRVPRMEVARA